MKEHEDITSDMINSGALASPLLDHQLRARLMVAQYHNKQVINTDQMLLTTDDVYVLSYSYLLGNYQCVISTVVPDARIYKVTYNWQKSLTYIDVYDKWESVSVRDGDELKWSLK